MIELGCCSFALGTPFEDSLRLISALGFRRVDVSVSRVGAQAEIDQDEAVRDPEGCAATVRDLLRRYGLQPEELFNTKMHVAGQRVDVNDPAAEVRAEVLRRFERLCVLAALAGFKSIMGVPGPVQPALDAPQSWELSQAMLHKMVTIAAAQGVRLNVEPHGGSLLESPSAALAMARAVPGLTYTLDYSHFVARGDAQGDVAPLHAYATHMHARQASKGRLYTTLADGAIDFRPIVGALRAANWDGVIALEYSAEATAGLRSNAIVQNVLLACHLEEMLKP